MFTVDTSIITGSTKGIEKATAILFVKSWLDVVVSPRVQKEVEKPG
ncbi:MAG: hypothetical protein M3162_05660 [Thermoproteota archaeon]|nr:hypothetical protein [Thermoproteota archaeon]